MRKIKNEKVIVAMSGGVDSSVAAALLKRGGFEVVGVFMKLGEWSRENKERAKAVARKLKIPFYVFDFEKEFKKKVVDYFLKELKKGRTPNPCVVCNKEIKFGLLFKKAFSLGADFIATGHYARIKLQNAKHKTQNSNLKFKTYKLLKGKDREKDQSYFLWKLNQKQLKHILFPVGNYTKNQVRALARKFGLPTAKTLESMEICFIQKTIHPVKSRRAGISLETKLFNGVNDFSKKYLKIKSGNIIDKKGKIIGRHEGLWFYTIGQRKGIGLNSGPYWVINKDIKKNLLIVTKNEKDLYKKELIAKNVNWLAGNSLKLPIRVKAKIRYRHQTVPAVITKNLQSKI